MHSNYDINALAAQAEALCGQSFAHIDAVAQKNSLKVLKAFQKARVSDAMFAGTTGYGYDDQGRDVLDNIYADVFGAEDAIVRVQFVNGTHTIACALFGALRPGDTLLSITGAPYDTLQSVIGITGNCTGSLKEYGISYRELPFDVELPGIEDALADDSVKAVLIQRSRGYSTRAALSIDQISKMIKRVKDIKSDVWVIVDNCYGEFVEELEPTQVGADIIAGSLIKNPGGGLAPTGGYIAGRHECVEAAAARLTSPGIGRECGCTLGTNRALYQGFFTAPHTVAQALKTGVFCAAILNQLGFKVSPNAEEIRHDIIQTVELGKPELVRAFCKGIQAGAPVDSYVTPEPWEMPGYDCQVIMAAGAFIQGASIEISADAPMREPYMVYLQGGLTYETGKACVLRAVEEML